MCDIRKLRGIILSEFLIKDILADNETEYYKKRVLRTLQDVKREGMPKTILIRKTQYLNRRNRDDILFDLMDAGLIVLKEMKMGKRGFVTNIFYAQEFAP